MSKKVNLLEAIKEFKDGVTQIVPFKWFNTAYKVVRKLTRIKHFSNYQRMLASNGQRIRAVVLDCVQKRKNRENKSEVDLLSLFLENRDVFTDDAIVDELIGFLLAGVMPLQYAM